MRLMPCGDVGVLAELDGVDEVLALHAELVAHPPPGVVDLVPAARTLLVKLDPHRTSVDEVAAVLRRTRPGDGVRGSSPTILIPTVYDGDDLETVAGITGLGVAGVVEAHTAQVWTVAFAGFTPGFGYLVGNDDRLHVPRKRDPRRRVPTGAVALAGEFSGVYPRESPGGWQLIGRTDVPMWDLSRDPPSLLRPGAQVRFAAVP